MKRQSLLITSILSLGLSFASYAKEEAKLTPAKLSDFKMGSLVTGDQSDVDNLTGKVVVLEFWGTHCGPCLAAMPSFVDMDKRMGKKGLQVIGLEAQQSSEGEIKGIVDKMKIKFPVLAGGNAPAAHSFSGIPHTFVFSAAGDLVYSGHPGDEMEKIVKKEMKNVDGATAAASAAPASKPAAAPTASSIPATKPAAAAANVAPLIPNRAWANTEGKIMNAALLSIEGDTGKFKSPTGQLFNYAISKLSEGDQDYIKKNAK